MLLDNLMTPKEVAQLLKRTTSTLSRWRQIGTGPKYLALGKRYFYRRSWINAWLTSRVVTPENATASRISK